MSNLNSQNKKRCFGNKPGQEFYAQYHDREWGIPVQDDRVLFEMLILEGAQAGLSWETILKRRQAYRDLFFNFDPQKVSLMDDSQLEIILKNERVIRNRLKIYSVRQNARVFLTIQQKYGTFSDYLWSYVDGKPFVNRPASFSAVPAFTELSLMISKDLKKKGMSFVGPKIIYAYMQAVGLVNDHLIDCWCCEI